MNVTNTALLSVLKVSIWSGKKTEKDISKQIDQQYNAVKAGTFTKSLLSSEALASINAVANSARTYHTRLTLPWGATESRLLPASLYIDYSTEMSGLKAQFEQEVSKFLAEYDNHINTAMATLGGLFKSTDYPDKESIESKFRFAVSILPIADPSSAGNVAIGQYTEDLKDMVTKEIDENLKGVVASIWIRLRDVVYSMSQTLAVESKVFRNSLVSNIVETVKLCKDLNITNDADIDNALQYLEVNFCHLDVDALRNNPSYRTQTATMAATTVTMIEEYL